MRLPSSLWLLLPIGALLGGFGGCSTTLGEGVTSTSGSVAVSAGSGSGSGTGGFSSGVGGGSTTGHLAAACTTDADCGGDLSCLGPDDVDPIFGGGAPGGFCTKACDEDVECSNDDGVCVKDDPNQPGRCTLPCNLGPAITDVQELFTPLGKSKCRGRDDVRCAKTVNGPGVCLPTCGEDAQCGSGHCDPRAAVCVGTPSTGDPTGAACDLSQANTTCAGLCVGFQTGVAMCSEPCVLGGDEPHPPACGGLEHGLCAFRPMGDGAGDTGFCTPACAAQSDCQTPYFWCFGVELPTSQVHKGYCFGATPCPGGQSDCEDGGDAGTGDAGAADAGATDAGASNAGLVCTKTPSGPLCLDPAFALEAPGDAGAVDAGL